MTIRLLSNETINHIAAGEVIERPASALKELVENSIDAGADTLHITLCEGGKLHIGVCDNGSGMSPEDLVLSIERHATSKLPDNNLFNIQSLGFRGEALSSISAVARVTIKTRQAHAPLGHQLCVEGGHASPLTHTKVPVGTSIDVYDLFYATPARLKFLKGATAEFRACMDVIERLALAHGHVAFHVMHNDKLVLKLTHDMTVHERLDALICRDFSQNMLSVLPYLDADFEHITTEGYISVPTYHGSNTTKQYAFVNGRPVKDKLLLMAIKLAYKDYIPHGRYGLTCLHIRIPAMHVDMNVHPSKVEVRFLNSENVRRHITRTLVHTLSQGGTQTSSRLSDNALRALQPSSSQLSFESQKNNTLQTPSSNEGTHFAQPFLKSAPPEVRPKQNPSPLARDASLKADRPFASPNPLASESSYAPSASIASNKETLLSPASIHAKAQDQTNATPLPHVSSHNNTLGRACAQLFNSYILSEATDCFYIVDQHAAAERLMYEKLKQQLDMSESSAQSLLIPEIISLKAGEADLLMSIRPELESMGLVFDRFGETDISVRAIPPLLSKENIQEIMRDILMEARNDDTESGQESDKMSAFDIYENSAHHPSPLKQRILKRLASIACHGSVRFGRALSLTEMNALLRNIESCAFSNQCIHGRPSFIKMERRHITQLFERT